MSKTLKHMLAAHLEEDLEQVTGLVLIDPGAMSVEANMAFRHDLRERAGGARLRHIHNRTARVALERKAYAGDAGGFAAQLRGPSAVAFGGDGAVSIAKVVRDWRRKQRDLRIKGAVADGEILLDADAEALADMPDLQQLKGMLAGLIIGSARGIAVSLQAVYGGLARALQARIEQQEGEGSDEAASPEAVAPEAVVPQEGAPQEGGAAPASE